MSLCVSHGRTRNNRKTSRQKPLYAKGDLKMVEQRSDSGRAVIRRRSGLLAMCATLLAFSASVFAVEVNVVSPTADGASITVGFRWTLEEDVTYPAIPGTSLSETQATNLHKSYMPVIAEGHSDSATATVTVPDATKRYYLSVLPDQPDGTQPSGITSDCQAGDNCYTMSGTQILPGQTSVRVVVTPQPLPTAQVFLRAFEDNAPINNAWDTGEVGLGGFTVFIYDFSGGQLSVDNYGNPLGTVYEGLNAGDSTPQIKRLGDGTIHTMTVDEVNDPLRNPYGLVVGEALIKNLAPGKYGVRMVPPPASEFAPAMMWQQSTTIEGTPGQDVWVKAGEPRYFAEFGPAGHHAEFGFVRPDNFAPMGGTASVTGTVRNLHMARPPAIAWETGNPLAGCWVGLNNQLGTEGLAAVPCNEDSTFEITGVPAGIYQLVVFDKYLDLIFNIQTIEVLADTNGNGIDLSVPEETTRTFRWYGTQDHYVFMDDGCGDPAFAEDGIRQDCEVGIPEQAINLRFRDGSIYATSTTDLDGYLPFDEVFPFFSWLVAEVDYLRFKPTGVTIATDNGAKKNGDPIDIGPIGQGKLNPQIQNPADGGSNCDATGANCQTRTEVGPAVLLEGYNAFIGMFDRFEWGKVPWKAGENGGIAGIVYYATTRAEDDPRFAAAEPWEPGVPRVQVNLYKSDQFGAIQENNGIAGIQFADVDNYPFGWQDGGVRGDEDVDHNGNGSFDMGDAIEVGHTDSFDDNPPTDCPADSDDPTQMNSQFHLPPAGEAATQFNGRCYDGLRNFNQVRPAVFDGGYGLGAPFSGQQLDSGFYVVEAKTPPGYKLVTEQDKNVDFGDTFTINPLALPPICVGDDNVIAANEQLSLFPGVDAPFQGTTRQLCDRKLVQVTDGKNTAADFFLFTDVPIAGHLQGFILNDLANEFDPNSPNFGEKFAPSFIPVSVRDYAGNEVYHTTSDQWGTYNAILPSSYRINTPMASGVSANLLQVCLNSPFKDDPANPGQLIPDPFFNKQYTQFCYTFNFHAGLTTYLDTPVLPIAAYAGPGNAQSDCEYPDLTPAILWASVDGSNGPYVSVSGPRTITIQSVGTVDVPDPGQIRADGNNYATIQRDFGFGTVAGSVTINGVELTGVTWGDGSITGTIPADATTGQLVVTRADNGSSTVDAVTVIIDDGTISTVTPVMPGESIQAAIDATPAGGVVMVAPGTYIESLIITKPIQLQSWGARSTVLNAAQIPSDKIARWRQKVNYLANCTNEIGLLPTQGNNTGSASGECGFTPGTGLFTNSEGSGILVAPRNGAFNGNQRARIDGFTITGADQSGGIVVNAYAQFLEISNNLITNNQATIGAGGIRVGAVSLLDANDNWSDADNDYLNIHNNHISQNGSLFEPGAGIGMYTGSENYRITNNYVCGNFAQSGGGGIAHYGLSNNGLIADNKILLNQSFDQTVGTGSDGGGILIAGHDPLIGGGVAVSAGSGNVKVLRNLIQANNAGSSDGGGIALSSVNGADVIASGNPARWNHVDVLNNILANNVAGLTAGGMSLKDSLQVSIVGNTVMNNDSTATAALAFTANGCGSLIPSLSCPQPAGIVSYATSAALNAIRPNRVDDFSNPTMMNNIVLGNRSQHWDAAANGGLGGLVIDPGFTDFAVVGVVGAQLTTTYSVIEATADVVPEDPLNPPTNIIGSGVLSAEEDFVDNPYRNSPPGNGTLNPDGTFYPGGEFPIPAAAAADEGGNFIDVHFGPLSPAGDYHLQTTTTAANAAADAGAAPSAYPNAALDIDRDARPQGADLASALYDIGADEIPGAVTGDGGNQAPRITTPRNGNNNGNNNFSAYVGVTFSLQVVASDPNGDALTYSLCRGGLGASGGCNTGSGNYPGLPTGMTIDPSSGLIAWPDPSGTLGNLNNFRVTASDGSLSDTNVFRIVLRNADAPVAVNDRRQIRGGGLWTVAARRGVLRNDTIPNEADYGVTEARIVSNLTSGGNVALRPDGGFTYTPAPSSFIGTTTFEYAAANNAGSSTATVTLIRSIAITDARHVPGVGYHITGFGIPGETLTIYVDPPRRGNRNRRVLGTVTPDAGDGSWTLDAGGAFVAGSVIDIWSNVRAHRVNNFALFSETANSAPLSTSFVQCALDSNGNGELDAGEGYIDDDTHNGTYNWVDPARPHKVCRHLAAGDGFARMADDKEIYGFGFNDLTGTASNLAVDKGILNAQYPAPTLEFNEGDEVNLTLTNVGMLVRPDIFDPHTVHFHGFPNASTVFDGVPESSIAINAGFSLTYYYKTVQPGTFMYHCHVEAAEHMQMGMLGNLYVNPAQNGTSYTVDGDTFTKFVYNDGDGSTGYDVVVPIQIGSFDSSFHDASQAVQPLPFAEMHDDYPLLNGRGYPDTRSTGDVPVLPGGNKQSAGITSSNESSQKVSSAITATAGQRILLRISNLNVTQFNTLATTGLNMQVVGTGAHILRGPETVNGDGSTSAGADLYYDTNSITLGGGEAVDVLIDTTGVTPGTYFLYSTNLNELSNGTEDFGGMMTEIVIN